MLVLALLLGGCASHGSGVLQVSEQHAPLQSPNPGGYGSSWDVDRSYDLAISGFENVTTSPIRVLSDSTSTVGGLVVAGVYLQVLDSSGQPQEGIVPTPLTDYRSGQPVKTIPVTSLIRPHEWEAFLVRIHLAPKSKVGAIYFVTLTYRSKGERFRTEYKMPFVLCASPRTDPTCAALVRAGMKKAA